MYSTCEPRTRNADPTIRTDIYIRNGKRQSLVKFVQRNELTFVCRSDSHPKATAWRSCPCRCGGDHHATTTEIVTRRHSSTTKRVATRISRYVFSYIGTHHLLHFARRAPILRSRPTRCRFEHVRRVWHDYSWHRVASHTFSSFILCITVLRPNQTKKFSREILATVSFDHCEEVHRMGARERKERCEVRTDLLTVDGRTPHKTFFCKSVGSLKDSYRWTVRIPIPNPSVTPIDPI